jgi:hypothetical protein
MRFKFISQQIVSKALEKIVRMRKIKDIARILYLIAAVNGVIIAAF